MNLALSALYRLCCGKTQSNQDLRKRIEDCKRLASSAFVLTLLLTIIINRAAAQSQQTETVTVSQAVQEAVDKNLNLLAERYNLSVADAHIATSRLRPNPVLSVYGDLLDLAGTGFNAQNTAGPPEYGIRTDFIFERGQKRRYRIEVAEQQRTVVPFTLEELWRQALARRPDYQ